MIHSQGDRIGFALGGLGGFNAHGVGFLEAAKRKGIVPDMITCTSGMIYWTAKYLEDEDLEKLLLEQVKASNNYPPPFQWMNLMSLGWMGTPGVFRPAVIEYWKRWMSPMSEVSAKQLFDRLLPAQLFVPLRRLEEFGQIAKTLNESPIGIMFNTFSPQKGKCYLHMNEAARELKKVHLGAPEDRYSAITAEAVRGALWLYLYGFEEDAETGGLIDGAYNRQFIVSELSRCNRIYIVRPQNSSWLGHLPRNYFEIENFKIQTWLNSAYLAEIAGLETINRLLKRNPDLKREEGDEPYREINFIPVEVQQNYELFDYFIEDKETYDRSLEASMEALTANEPPLAAPG